MKKYNTILIAFLIFIMVFTGNLFADQPPDPGGGGPGGGDLPVGGGSPLGTGLLLLAALGAAYGTVKSFLVKRKKDNHP